MWPVWPSIQPLIIPTQHPRHSLHNLRQESPLPVNIASLTENPNTLFAQPVLDLPLRHLIMRRVIAERFDAPRAEVTVLAAVRGFVTGALKCGLQRQTHAEDVLFDGIGRRWWRCCDCGG